MIKNNQIETQVVIIGAGPSGYSAAFRCSDLGLKTVLIERYPTLGGVCLNVGCIPSKAFLHISKILKEINFLNNTGIIHEKYKLNIDNLRLWKENIINSLTNGLSYLANLRKVKVVQGMASFMNSNCICVKDNNDNDLLIKFNNAIIATGSYVNSSSLSNYDDDRIWDSSDALSLKFIPKKMLVVGGGIIGLEMSSAYNSFGSQIDIVEISDKIIPEVDDDMAKIFLKEINKDINILLQRKILKITPNKNNINVIIESKDKKIISNNYDAILFSIGRSPNSGNMNLDNIGVKIDSNGFIVVDKQMKTNIDNIYAIGDVAGKPMLAHKGVHEGHLAAEVIYGFNYYFNPKAIPCVAYTDPEFAWVGITEKEAKNRNINYDFAIFPWKASGKALISNSSNGATKLLLNKETNRIIGGSIIGTNAGELIGEISLAIEMGCDIEDVALTIHAHPSLYETIGMAAKILSGSVTDVLNKKANF